MRVYTEVAEEAPPPPPDIEVNDNSDSMAYYGLTQKHWEAFVCVGGRRGGSPGALCGSSVNVRRLCCQGERKPQSGWFSGKWYNIYSWHSGRSWLRSGGVTSILAVPSQVRAPLQECWWLSVNELHSSKGHVVFSIRGGFLCYFHTWIAHCGYSITSEYFDLVLFSVFWALCKRHKQRLVPDSSLAPCQHLLIICPV